MSIAVRCALQRRRLRGDDLQIVGRARACTAALAMSSDSCAACTASRFAPALPAPECAARRADPRPAETPSAPSADRSRPTRRTPPPAGRPAPAACRRRTASPPAADRPTRSGSAASTTARGSCSRIRRTRSSVRIGKNAAFAMPICSFAAATGRSAAVMSGRRSSSADGTPIGITAAAASSATAGGIDTLAGGLPMRMAIACSNCARATPTSISCARVDVELRLRLRHVGARRDAGVEAILRQLQRLLDRASRVRCSRSASPSRPCSWK